MHNAYVKNGALSVCDGNEKAVDKQRTMLLK